jgi:hypothetical protein
MGAQRRLDFLPLDAKAPDQRSKAGPHMASLPAIEQPSRFEMER